MLTACVGVCLNRRKENLPLEQKSYKRRLQNTQTHTHTHTHTYTHKHIHIHKNPMIDLRLTEPNKYTKLLRCGQMVSEWILYSAVSNCLTDSVQCSEYCTVLFRLLYQTVWLTVYSAVNIVQCCVGYRIKLLQSFKITASQSAVLCTTAPCYGLSLVPLVFVSRYSEIEEERKKERKEKKGRKKERKKQTNKQTK